MMIDFDMIWDLLLKRQRELGEFHPDLPSSQGPIVGYHGRNFSIRHDNPGFSDRYQDAVRGERYSHEERNEMLDRGESPFQTAEEFFDEERAKVDRRKSDQIAREGILPTDQSESQIGSGRWTQDRYTEELTFHPDIEPNVSVASEVDTAMTYARGMSGYKDSSGNPALYGVRAGAMDRLQDMDEPRRRYGTLSQYVLGDDSRGDKDAAQFRFITGGLRPNELTRIPIDQAKEFAHGRREDWSRGIDDRFVPSRFESHGPDKIWRQNYTDKWDMNKPNEENWANAHPAAGAQQDWINSQVQAWRDKNEAMRRGKEERAELERKNREDLERFSQTRLDDFGKSFDYVWAMITKSIDSDENDDEFIDNERFSNKPARVIRDILDIFGLNDLLECFSCGFEGETQDFVGWHGSRGRKCPNCNSYEVHSPDSLAAGDDYKFKDETYEEEIARRNEYYRKIHEENERRKREEE